MTHRIAPEDRGLIGVFDSGVGGISVLRALHARLPNARLHYVADSLHAPYGDRSAQEVTERSLRVTQHLLGLGARLVVVACNTATTTAIGALRAHWPQVPFVGVEPGIKPAVARSRNGRIAVMATRRTVESERMRALVEQHASQRTVLLQACPGLVDAIEGGDAQLAAVDMLLRRYCEPLIEAQVDTVVLGCTHYPFVAERIRALMGPQVTLVDTADAIAQRTESLWPAESSSPTTHGGLPGLQTTGEPEVLSALARRWLHPAARAERVVI